MSTFRKFGEPEPTDQRARGRRPWQRAVLAIVHFVESFAREIHLMAGIAFVTLTMFAYLPELIETTARYGVGGVGVVTLYMLGGMIFAFGPYFRLLRGPIAWLKDRWPEAPPETEEPNS